MSICQCFRLKSKFKCVGQINKKLGWSLDERDPRFIKSVMPLMGWIYDHYFRVQTSGWHHISPQEKVLFVGSHNGGLAAPDMLMMMYDWFRQFGVEQPVYGLMHPTVWEVTPSSLRFDASNSLGSHPINSKTSSQNGSNRGSSQNGLCCFAFWS